MAARTQAAQRPIQFAARAQGRDVVGLSRFDLNSDRSVPDTVGVRSKLRRPPPPPFYR